jgi:hypothetical protein
MRRSVAVASAILTAAGLGMAAVAGADNDRGKPVRVRATLTGYSEVAFSATTTANGDAHSTAVTTVGAISTTGRGTFRADIDEASGIITYTLKYSNLTGDVRQSHLHFGQHHTAGGISVWLCQTTANPAPGTQATATPFCAPEVSGKIVAANVIGPAGQGIAAGEFAELVAAIRAGVVYVNVHSSVYPAGEIRGQLF